MRCPNGHPHPVGAGFCPTCGAPLTGSISPDATPTAAAPGPPPPPPPGDPTPWHAEEPARRLAQWALPLGIGGVLTDPSLTKKTKTVIIAVVLVLLAIGVVVFVATGDSSST